SFEIAFVGGQQRDQMAAGGMAADKDLIGSAAVFSDIGMRPGEGAGDIFHVFRMHDPRRQSIIGHDYAQTLSRPTRSEMAIEAQVKQTANSPQQAQLSRLISKNP